MGELKVDGVVKTTEELHDENVARQPRSSTRSTAAASTGSAARLSSSGSSWE